MNAPTLGLLRARSIVLLSAIPDAPYRAALKLFHDEMLELIAVISEKKYEVWLYQTIIADLSDKLASIHLIASKRNDVMTTVSRGQGIAGEYAKEIIQEDIPL